MSKGQAVFDRRSAQPHADAQGYTRYAVAWDGFIDIPADGGYTFHLIARDGARLVIDGMEVAKTGPPFAQVAARLATRSATIAARWVCARASTLHLEGLHSVSQGSPRLLWEGPALPLTDVPAAAFSHPGGRADVIAAE